MSDHLIRMQALLHSIERALDNFKKIGKNNYTPGKIRSRMNTLKDTWSQCIQTHAALLQAITETTRKTMDYFILNAFDNGEDLYQAALDYMTECLETLEPPVSPFHNSSSLGIRDPTALSLQHLPSIKLPPFSGKFDEWESFRDRFVSLIIKNSDLSDFARMHFLSSSLTGQALDPIKNFTITADNFELAWKALTSRYENKRRLVEGHVAALFNLPTLQRESASELSDLRDSASRAIASLRKLGRSSEEILSDILCYSVSQKLDPATRKAWKLKGSEASVIPAFDDLDKFITARARALEELTAFSVIRSPRTTKVTAATASTASADTCSMCKASHFLSKCPKFIAKTPIQRREIVKQAKRCLNCLSTKHSLQSCPSKYACRTCQKRHHSMLHSDSASPASVSGSASPSHDATELSDTSAVNALCSTLNSAFRPQVLLATARVAVSSNTGRTLVVRALIDPGSEITFITESLRQLLRLRRAKMPVAISAVGSVNVGTCRYAADIRLSPPGKSHPVISATASVLQSLTSYAPFCTTSLTQWDHLANLALADPDPFSSEPIHILIGADLYSDLLLDGVAKGLSGEPSAQNTIFGWVLSGPTRRASQSPSRITVQHCTGSMSLDRELRNFWEIEEIPQNPPLTPEDQQCENHFSTTHSRSSDGRYIVRLPFKQGPPIEIGHSRDKAAGQLTNLIRRFKACSTLQTEYVEFLREYEQLGHMRKTLASETIPSDCVYIPHHPVIRDSSLTTRLRVVFNASSVTSNGTSLNHHLLIGAKLQTDLSAVILRWRQYRYVYTADIAKMYRQILVDPRDVDYQRILWIDEDTTSPQDYQLLTVTYGTSCAPFLALRVLRQLIQDEGQSFPLAVSVLQDNIYVDDVLFGADEISSLLQTRLQVCDLLQRGHFELRKWASNTSDLLHDIAPENHGLACSKSLSTNERVKILGIDWSPSLDAFQFKVALPGSMPNSKRSVLSFIAKLFDPLGWVTPVIITAKVFLQTLWQDQIGWDDTLPDHLHLKWQSIHSSLAAVDGLTVHRWINLGSTTRTFELHGFADASTVAYAAAIYLRTISHSNEIVTTLLAGKSKVAPVKTCSIPRLELSAALLLARLMKFVQTSLSFSSAPCHCWTDSTVVLAWLSQHPSRWKTFVSNRVAEIQSLLPNGIWHHVSSEENSADCASRGLSGDQLASFKLWWQGPTWLHQDASDWSLFDQTSSHETSLEERLAAKTHLTTATDRWELETRYSSWPKLIRVTAYVLRFTHRARLSKQAPAWAPASTESVRAAVLASELTEARVFWIRRLQTELFSADREALAKGRSLPSRSPLLALNPFLDKDEIIRVGGRLSNAPIPFSAKHPVILAAHPLVTLIVRHVHLRALHAGVQLTLATLRQEYWILRSRNLVKSVIYRCVVCTREKAASPTQLMGNLPKIRVTSSSRAFLHCGVDYAGPVFIRSMSGRGIASKKAYIAVFVCMVTRAVHLELVDGYATPAFLSAYSRFCARRGLPSSMYSDNGTTFIGADRELTSAFRAALRDPDIQTRIASDHVTWHFIPPAAPHFGGLWESGVRSVKHHLRRVIGAHTLTFEEFCTLLCNIEACLNSRPIAPLTDTLDDYETLTPGHFLIGSALSAKPEPSLLDVKENRLSRWQTVRQLTERFWKLWQSDYVNTLQQRVKWKRVASKFLTVGRLVLLKNSLLPPCKWELGRITQCHSGTDGLVRVVTIKTASSEYKRPLTGICLLPIDVEKTRQ